MPTTPGNPYKTVTMNGPHGEFKISQRGRFREEFEDTFIYEESSQRLIFTADYSSRNDEGYRTVLHAASLDGNAGFPLSISQPYPVLKLRDSEEQRIKENIMYAFYTRHIFNMLKEVQPGSDVKHVEFKWELAQ